jgi:hypothetical protein
MYKLSWFYLYGVGGAIYALGTYLCTRAGVLDFGDRRERGMFAWATAAMILFAVIHALFQFVFPFVG